MNIGGAETYVFTAVKELQKRGRHEIFLASGGGHAINSLLFIVVVNSFPKSSHLFSFPIQSEMENTFPT